MTRKIMNIFFSLLNVVFLYFLIGLFLYAAYIKLHSHALFKFQLGKSPYTMAFAGVISWLLPVIELLIAALLIDKKYRSIGLYTSFFLMLLFTGYILILLNYSYYIPCSCGGILENMSWHQHLIFNTIVTLGILIKILVHKDVENAFPAIAIRAFSRKEGM